MVQVHAVNAFSDNYIWLLQADNSRHVIIVDPGIAEPVLRKLQALHCIPVAIIITHHHADHIGGVDDLLAQYTIPVYGPADESIPTVSQALTATDSLLIHPDFPTFSVLNTPGHTIGHISYLVENKLFCGDTLFAGGCGRLLGGTAAALLNSLEKIRQLASQTQVYCAHEYTEANLRFALEVDPTNHRLQQRAETVRQDRQQHKATVPSLLADEVETNPFLRCDDPMIKRAVEQHANCDLVDTLAVFSELRKWKDQF